MDNTILPLLTEYHTFSGRIKCLELQKKIRIAEINEGVGSLDYTRDRLSPSYNNVNVIEENYIKKEADIEKITKLINDLKNKKALVEAAVSALNQEEQFLFYVEYNEMYGRSRSDKLDKLKMTKNTYYKIKKEVITKMKRLLTY